MDTTRIPIVGDSVHYHGPIRGVPQDGPLAATITSVHADGTANLHVLKPHGGADWLTAVPFSDTPKPGHWCWR